MSKHLLTGQELVDTLRKLCDCATSRLWIAVPFIGSWRYVERIIGTKWTSDLRVDVRLITDTTNEPFLKRDTIKKFQQRSEIRDLAGLHAKIYIIDNKALLTSANLTGTAFTRRHEIGFLFDYSKEIGKIFKYWWKVGRRIDSSWLPADVSATRREEPHTRQMSVKQITAKLPAPSTTLDVFKDYYDYLKAYNHFKNVYAQNIHRIWHGIPIYHEIDSFLNYLYHEHPRTPSKKYNYRKHRWKKPRKLTDRQRISELKNHTNQFKQWLPTSHWESKRFRLGRIRTIQQLLSPKNIHKISRKDVESVISCIHAMESIDLNPVMFLKPQNNDLATIRDAWHNLLHNDSKPIELRMEECNNSLFRFGRSSIQELISCYWPRIYPMINVNSICGLRFFGYDIKIY